MPRERNAFDSDRVFVHAMLADAEDGVKYTNSDC